MGDPRERQEALNAELAASRRALQNARQKAKRAAKAQSALWCLAPELKRVASIAYDLAECVAEPSVRFLNDAAGKREWPEKGQQEVQAVVEALFLAADAAEVASLTDPSEPADQHAFREAAKHMQEWRVVAWARSCNAQQGVAPSTEALLQRVEEERRRLPEAARPPPRGSGAEAKGRMWASRLRVRGGGGHGSIRVRDDVPLQEMGGTVVRTSCFTCFGRGIAIVHDGVRFGRQLAPPLRAQVIPGWGRLRGPESGAQCIQI